MPLKSYSNVWKRPKGHLAELACAAVDEGFVGDPGIELSDSNALVLRADTPGTCLYLLPNTIEGHWCLLDVR